jgi:hypothetical protein
MIIWRCRRIVDGDTACLHGEDGQRDDCHDEKWIGWLHGKVKYQIQRQASPDKKVLNQIGTKTILARFSTVAL